MEPKWAAQRRQELPNELQEMHSLMQHQKTPTQLEKLKGMSKISILLYFSPLHSSVSWFINFAAIFGYRLTASQMLEQENKKMEDKLKVVQQLMEQERQK